MRLNNYGVRTRVQLLAYTRYTFPMLHLIKQEPLSSYNSVEITINNCVFISALRYRVSELHYCVRYNADGITDVTAQIGTEDKSIGAVINSILELPTADQIVEEKRQYLYKWLNKCV